MIEDQWLKLVACLGVAKPASMTEVGLNSWARPGEVTAARHHRPLLLDILNRARQGNLNPLVNKEIQFGGGTIELGQLPEFIQLIHLQPENTSDQLLRNLFDWVNVHIGHDAVQELTKANVENLRTLSSEIMDYVKIESAMYEKSIQYQAKYQEEDTKLNKVRRVIENPVFPDHKERVAYLDEYRQKALRPLIETIKANEEIREVYFNHHIKHIGDFIMSRVGIRAKALKLPTFHEIYEIMDTMPSFDQEDQFNQWKAAAAFSQVEDAWNETIEQLNRDFEASINIETSEKVVAIENGKVNIQINNCFGGTQKAVIFNPENQFSS